MGLENISDSEISSTPLATQARNWVLDHTDYLAIIVAYVLLTVLFTWPLVINFNKYVNGNEFDVYHELWYLNLDYTAPLGPFFLLYTTTILYPFGVPMYFQVLSPLHAIIGAPVYFLFGLIPAYNFLYMFTFVGSAFTAYLLVLYLTKNKYAAFFSGIAFGFAPVHLGQASDHLNIMASELLPLFALFLVKLVREENRERNAIYAGVVLALNAMLDLHFLLLCAIMLVVFLVYYFVVIRKLVLNKLFVIRLAVMLLTAGCIGIVAYFQTFYGLVFARASQGALAAATLSLHARTSADVLQFFLPSPENPILGPYTYSIFTGFNSAADVRTYIGYSVLALAVVGLAANRRRRSVFFWLVLTIVGFLIALGPAVEVDGQITPIQGVWAYLEDFVPLFRSFRTPFRIDYEVALGMAVLAGYGVAAVMSRLDRTSGTAMTRTRAKRWRRATSSPTFKKGLVLGILCTVVVIEFLPIPYAELDTQIPPAYTQILANDHSSFAVLDVPAYLNDRVYQYYQTAYNQPIVDGHISRTPPSSVIFVDGAPFVDLLGQYIENPKMASQQVLNQTLNVNALAPYILSQYDIKYVIVHKDLMPASLYHSSVSLLSNSLGLPVYNDSLTAVYEDQFPTSVGLVQYLDATNSSFIGILNGGWNPYGQLQSDASSMDASAGIQVFSRTNEAMQLVFDAEGVSADYHLQISVNGVYVGTYLVANDTYSVYTTPFVPLHQGLNQITFTSTEGCKIVVKGPITSPKAVACASGQFTNIAMVPAH